MKSESIQRILLKLMISNGVQGKGGNYVKA